MPDNTKQTGFTLIEILVVLVIVALMASLALFTLGGGQQRQLQAEVQDLYLRMQLVSEQAVMNNLEAGLVLAENGYQFVLLDEQARAWKTSDERVFQFHTLPQWLRVDADSASDTPRLTSENDRLRPNVVFFSSGETTPFEIRLDAAGQASDAHRLQSDGLTPVQWLKPGAGNGAP